MTDFNRRPKFAYWLLDRNRPHAEAAKAIGCSAYYVGRLCKPWADLRRAAPSLGMIEKIRSYTGGDVMPNDWLEPEAVESVA